MKMMMDCQANRVISAFDKAAALYDQHAKVQKSAALRLSKLLDEHNLTPTKVLEIGCGTGFLSQYLLKLFPSSSFNFSDFSPSMLRICKKNTSHKKNVKYSLMDMDHLKLHEKYDLTTSSLAFQWSQNIAKLLVFLSKYSHNIVFSTLLNGTFIEWSHLCKIYNMENGVLQLPSKSDLQKTMEKLNFKVKTYAETVRENFPSPFLFLQHCKKIGVHIPKKNYNARKQLPKAIFNKRSFHVSYQLCYCFMLRK